MKAARQVGRLWVEAIVGLALLAILTIAAIAYSRGPLRGLPFHDSFASGQAREWTAFGGTWQIADGTMRNDSDERGAKLLTGSRYWRDYSFSADVELLGKQGDAGLILRSSDEEQGVDSYSGYYVGLRSNDGTLVIGRADHGWIEMAAQPMPGGVHAFQWYHLKAIVDGCQISAIANEIPGGATEEASVTDRQCLLKGRIGLRSHSSGGVWKHLLVLPLTGAASPLTQAGPSTTPPTMPYAIDEPVVENGFLARGRSSTFSVGSVATKMGPEDGTQSSGPVENIGALRLVRTPARRVTIRGTVILNFPQIFVQDATGGVSVLSASKPRLKLGDEVEVTGEVEVRDYSCVIRNATIRLLWAHAPAPPLSVTAGQAATGAFDSMFIEVDGRLTGKRAGPDNTLLLTLKQNVQSFRAIVDRSRDNALVESLSNQSFLRLRGICVVDPQYTHNETPFVLLVPTSDDIEMLAGPPWWSTRNLLIMGLVAVTLALLCYLLYMHAKHWRLKAILEERERIAHEMHDTLAQSFVGIGFQLQAISNGVPESMQAINRQLDVARELVRHSHEEASRSLTTLRSEFLESEALHSALNAFASRMVENGPVTVNLTAVGDGAATPYRVKDALFRIGQEAIANAIRHADPSVLKIRVEYATSTVTISIEDNGRGFQPSGDLQGFGLTGIRKRAEGISAVLQLSSSLGRGTEVKVIAPLPPRFTLLKMSTYTWKWGKRRLSNANRFDKENPYSHRR